MVMRMTPSTKESTSLPLLSSVPVPLWSMKSNSTLNCFCVCILRTLSGMIRKDIVDEKYVDYSTQCRCERKSTVYGLINYNSTSLRGKNPRQRHQDEVQVLVVACREKKIVNTNIQICEWAQWMKFWGVMLNLVRWYFHYWQKHPKSNEILASW